VGDHTCMYIVSLGYDLGGYDLEGYDLGGYCPEVCPGDCVGDHTCMYIVSLFALGRQTG